jgi:hypothetical protein
MISISITTILLVAVAAAFSSSASLIENNDAFFRSGQAARVTVNQILAEIRNCDSMDMSAANAIKIIRPTATDVNAASQQYALAPNEWYRTFVYDPIGKRITLQITYLDSTVSPVYELTSNVTSCSFGPPDMGLDYNNSKIPVRVPLMLTISVGGNVVALNGSAAPRRATNY